MPRSIFIAPHPGSTESLSGIRERDVVSFSPLELLEGLEVPMVISDLDGKIRDANPAARAVYGLDELAGRPLAAGRLSETELGPWIVDCALERGSWRGRLEVAGAPLEARATPLADAVAVAFFTGRAADPGDNLRATIDSLSASVAVIDQGGNIVAVNAAWREHALSNGASSDFVGANYLEVCEASGADDAAVAARLLRELLDGTRESIEFEYQCADRWFAVRGMPYASDRQRCAIVIHLDVTERRRVHEKAFLQAALLDELDVAVMATDVDHRIISWNAGAERLYGWNAEEVVGRRADELMLSQSTYIDPAIGARLAGGRWDGECTSRRKDGSNFPAYFRISVVRDDRGRDSAVVWVAIDISARRKSEQDLKLARDYLRAVIDGIGQGMYTLDEQGRVAYMNQAAQDLLGWSLHDLQGRDLHDTLHHHRPDGAPFPREECPVLDIRRTGQMLRVEKDTFFRADGTMLPVAYTAAPFSGGDGFDGTVVVFEDISERQAQTRQMERDLEQLATIKRIRNALNEDGFVLYSQPIVELATGEAVQRELLIRMRDPDGGGVLAPGTFLPAAEEYGFISDIDRWVIARSAEAAAAGLAVELNISAASLGDPTLIEFIAGAIEHTGADPTKIVFEITETTLVSDQLAGRRFVTALHELGCRVALDDFGTGYGGFTYLKQLPVDYLKIDIEFVRDLAHSVASRKVVEAIVNLAHGFDLRTVAEGVEDAPTLALLRELGVDYAQGFFLGRPAELEL
jgi:PAS domain S-box-containing protein